MFKLFERSLIQKGDDAKTNKKHGLETLVLTQII